MYTEECLLQFGSYWKVISVRAVQTDVSRLFHGYEMVSGNVCAIGDCRVNSSV